MKENNRAEMSDCDMSVIWGNMRTCIYTLKLHERIYICTHMRLSNISINELLSLVENCASVFSNGHHCFSVFVLFQESILLIFHGRKEEDGEEEMIIHY